MFDGRRTCKRPVRPQLEHWLRGGLALGLLLAFALAGTTPLWGQRIGDGRLLERLRQRVREAVDDDTADQPAAPQTDSQAPLELGDPRRLVPLEDDPSRSGAPSAAGTPEPRRRGGLLERLRRRRAEAQRAEPTPREPQAAPLYGIGPEASNPQKRPVLSRLRALLEAPTGMQLPPGGPTAAPGYPYTPGDPAIAPPAYSGPMPPPSPPLQPVPPTQGAPSGAPRLRPVPEGLRLETPPPTPGGPPTGPPPPPPAAAFPGADQTPPPPPAAEMEGAAESPGEDEPEDKLVAPETIGQPGQPDEPMPTTEPEAAPPAEDASDGQPQPADETAGRSLGGFSGLLGNAARLFGGGQSGGSPSAEAGEETDAQLAPAKPLREGPSLMDIRRRILNQKQPAAPASAASSEDKPPAEAEPAEDDGTGSDEDTSEQTDETAPADSVPQLAPPQPAQ